MDTPLNVDNIQAPLAEKTTDLGRITTADLAALLGIPEKRLSVAVRDGYLPPTIVRGKYNLAEIVTQLWAKAYANKAKKHDAHARRIEAMARKGELEVGQLEGALISREDATRAQRRIITDARQILLGIPMQLAAQVPPEYRGHIEEVATIQIRTALRSLAEGMPDEEAITRQSERVECPAAAPGTGVVRQESDVVAARVADAGAVGDATTPV